MTQEQIFARNHSTMEAVLSPSSSLEKPVSVSPYKRIRNPRKINHNHKIVNTRPSENFAPSNLFNPPCLLTSSFYFSQRQQQPPLLPLPISKPYSSLPSPNRGLSSPPINRKINKTSRDNKDLTPKKSKPSMNPKKQHSRTTEKLLIASTNRLGPDPKDLPKEVSRVLKPIVSPTTATATAITMDGVELSSSVFLLSPPPSSLPLPKFSLRPKLGCNVKATGIDTGATDNLRPASVTSPVT